MDAPHENMADCAVPDILVLGEALGGGICHCGGEVGIRIRPYTHEKTQVTARRGAHESQDQSGM